MGYVTTFGEKIIDGAAKSTAKGFLSGPVAIVSTVALSAGLTFCGVKALVESDFVQLSPPQPTEIVEYYDMPSQTVPMVAETVQTTSTAAITTTAQQTTATAQETTVTTATIPQIADSQRFPKAYLLQPVEYPEVHLSGITLPEEYGDGLLDCEAVFWLIDNVRQSHGLEPFERGGGLLKKAANIRNIEIMDSFSQTRPNGASFTSVFGDCGIECEYCMESIGSGQYTAEHIVSDWLDSEKNLANILTTECTVAYISCSVDSGNVPLWVFVAVTPEANDCR